MSENYSSESSFNSSSDSWSSSYSDFSPSSSSFSTYDIFQQTKPNEPSNYSQSQYSSEAQFNRINFQNPKDDNADKGSTLQSVYEERNKQRYQDGHFYERNEEQRVNTSKQQKKLLQTLPYKKLEDFTIREVLQLPLARQEYLKSLSSEKLTQQAQFKYIFSRPDTVFQIGHHYQKEIKDEELRKQIVKIKARQDFGKGALLFSMVGYIFSAKYLQKHSPFKGQLRTKYHIVFPFTFMIGSVIFEGRMRKKKQRMLQDERVKAEFKNVVRKYLCETNQKERRKIVARELQQEKNNDKQ